MKRKWIIGATVLIVVVMGLAWRSISAASRSHPADMRTETADRGLVELKVTETGTIQPLKQVEVKSKVAGRIARLAVDEGSVVRAGQFLAEIDPKEINSQVAQIRAQWEGARSRGTQAERGVDFQVSQTQTGIEQARANLASTEARLKVALDESRAQPQLSDDEVAQAQASLQSAQQTLDLLNASGHPQAVVQAQTAFQQARITEANARRNLDRQKRLHDRGYASEQAVDAASNEVASAAANLDQARKRVELIDEQNRLEIAGAESHVAEARAALDHAKAGRSAVSVKQHQVEDARAAVRQARAQLAAALASRRQDDMRRDDVNQARATMTQLQNQLRQIEVSQFDTTIIAPMSGVVTHRYIEAGELVTSGVATFSSGTPILEIGDMSRMLIKMSVNEVDVYKVRPGLPVEISVDGARGEIFHGRVRRVAPAAGTTSGTTDTQQQSQSSNSVVRFAVEVVVENPDPRLRPGMTARSSIIIARRPDVVRVPVNCVDVKPGNATVQVVTEQVRNGRKQQVATPRKVTVGLMGDTYAEIVGGLKPGERVKPGAFTGPKRQGFEFGPGN